MMKKNIILQRIIQNSPTRRWIKLYNEVTSRFQFQFGSIWAGLVAFYGNTYYNNFLEGKFQQKKGSFLAILKPKRQILEQISARGLSG